jgi:tetratricopeptide (TPR) repeat protein
MYQTSGCLTYLNRRLLARSSVKGYNGVTHEYLDEATAGCIPAEKADFYDHADGANRPDKFKRDIALLKKGLKDEPTNERYFFYLAQSYRDAGKPAQAAEWYKRRIAAGGWDEEVWCAQFNLAQTWKDRKNEAEFVNNSLRAYNMRPSRGEVLYDLAKYYRETSQQTLGALFAEVGMKLPHSKDALFVNDFIYDFGLKEDFAICAFYVPEKREKGFSVCNELALTKTPYTGNRDLARTNLYHYLPTISSFAPSFKPIKLNFEAPKDYTAMNPSITVHKGELVMVIRTVNYRITDWGGYLIKATDGTANDSNPIHTRNFLVRLTPALDMMENAVEIHPPLDMPLPLYKPVIGFEDMRLFSWKDQLWTSSTVREMNAEGVCEQVRGRLRVNARNEMCVTDLHRMLRQPRLYEKNWMPLVEGGKLSFMYRPGELCDEYGTTYKKNEPAIAVDSFGGGTQLIPFNAGWLGLVHEARIIPGAQRRYYSHRFVYYDIDKKLRKVSKPFCFHEKEIEYAAGLCWHPNANQDQLVISYGFKDAEARIATVQPNEVNEWLWSD